MKKIVHIFLLFIFSFTISHGIILDIHQEKHCSVQSYVDEFSKPIQNSNNEYKSDFCSNHYLLHISFIIPSLFSLPKLDRPLVILSKEVSRYEFLHIKNNFRPPIFIFS
jgi:hypothetical protein